MARDPHHINRFKRVAGYSCVNTLQLHCKDQLPSHCYSAAGLYCIKRLSEEQEEAGRDIFTVAATHGGI